jgi:dihydroorotate dehydrogenase electron transfer subunit
MKLTPERTTVLKRRHIANDYYSLIFGPCSRAAKCLPGQFLHIRVPDSPVFFRRAMSIAAVDVDAGTTEIIFRAIGPGTRALAACRKGDTLDIISPLGNCFAAPRKNETALIVAGGIGFPPLLYFATELVGKGFDPHCIRFFYGGRTAADILERSRIRKLGIKFHPVTDDGSLGEPGLVTSAVERYLERSGVGGRRLYCCGPEPMLKAADALAERLGLPGQLSLEAPMPCGIGVCLGCIVPEKKGGHARVCQEGPIFEVGEVLL